MIRSKIRAALDRLDISRSLVRSQLAEGVAENRSAPTVLQIVRTYLPKTENWVYEQVRHVEKYRSVFASKAVVNLEMFPWHTIYSQSHASLSIRLVDREIKKRAGYSPFFSAVVARERASIIHVHGGGIGTFVAGSATRAGIPLIVSFYGTDMWTHPNGESGLRRKYADLFKRGSLFLAEGPAAAAQLTLIGCPRDRIVVHRIGVDVSAIPFKPRDLHDGSQLRVLIASRFVEKKGIPYGVEGFCRVARDNPGIRLTIVGDSGSSRDKKMKRVIRHIARRYGITDRVAILRFMGREKLRELAEEHHVLLHPSIKAANGDSEGGHPVVMPMLAASGMPILATRHCDIPEIVRDKQTGWLVDEKNADQIEATFRRIIRNPSIIKPFGVAARRLAEEKYDIVSLRLDSVYDRVLPGG